MEVNYPNGYIEVIVTDDRVINYGLPTTQTAGSAGLDLRAFLPAGVSEIELQPGEQMTLDTGLRVWIKNPQFAGIILPRSSTGKAGLVLANTAGVIDSDYQGPLKLIVWNRGTQAIKINDGDRVAQMLVMPVATGYGLKMVTEFSGSTERGSGGFGSTGRQ